MTNEIGYKGLLALIQHKSTSHVTLYTSSKHRVSQVVVAQDEPLCKGKERIGVFTTYHAVTCNDTPYPELPTEGADGRIFISIRTYGPSALQALLVLAVKEYQVHQGMPFFRTYQQNYGGDTPETRELAYWCIAREGEENPTRRKVMTVHIGQYSLDLADQEASVCHMSWFTRADKTMSTEWVLYDFDCSYDAEQQRIKTKERVK